MNLLILGSGGREHAIAWKISQSELLDKLYVLPGNPGTGVIAENLPGKVSDFEAIKEAVIEKRIDLVVVGPEDPLVNGLKDFFKGDPLLKDVIFIGPDRYAASLEGSKEFAKEFMVRNGIPTARYRSFEMKEIEEAVNFMETLSPPYVLKADGLAGGKGVLILDDRDEAADELKKMFSGKFGKAGEKVVIEEFLRGIELSVFVLTDGESYMILPEAKDYKRIGEGDRGLNTGGMGAVSPVPFADKEFLSKVEERIIRPTIRGIKSEDLDYKGFIFIGLMNCGGDPYVIEYNVRMGDPETEAVMPRIKSDLLSHLISLSKGSLKDETLVTDDRTAVTVISVSGGYPEKYGTGYKIEGVDQMKETLLFHSGTVKRDGELVTSGGRVLAVTSLAASIPRAREIVYEELSKVRFKDIYFRKDIGVDLL